MVKQNIITKVRRVTGFNRFSKFIAIGHNVDGFVSFDFEEYENWEELIQKFPKAFQNTQFEGEWNIEIYQVADQYKLTKKYGYYEVPKKGKIISKLSYMMVGNQNKLFMSNNLIQLESTSKYYDENWDDNGLDHDNIEIYQESHITLLFDAVDLIECTNEEYPGDLEGLLLEKYN